GEHLGKPFLTTEKMMSSSYWSETSSSSCGTQQPTEVLQCQPQHYHCYHQSSQAQQPPEKNVVYERVRTYSGPMNKVVQALDPLGSREVLSPLKTASSYQNLVWSDHSQTLVRLAVQSGAGFWSVCNITYCNGNPKHTKSCGNAVIAMKFRTMMIQPVHKLKAFSKGLEPKCVRFGKLLTFWKRTQLWRASEWLPSVVSVVTNFRWQQLARSGASFSMMSTGRGIDKKP
ncbi:hypothetical protein A6R68_02988, partial [Neotoma lepida]